MRLRDRARLLGLVGALLSATLRLAAAEPPVSAQFDCAVTHPYSGFGLNVWPLPERFPAVLELLPQLRVNFVRTPLLPSAQAEDVPDGLSFDGLIEWLEGVGRKQHRLGREGGLAMLQRLQSLGIALVPASWAVPRGWRNNAPQQTPGGQARHIKDAHVEDYGRLVAAGVSLLARHGIRLHAIELLNEPAGRLSPLQYGRLIRSFRSWQSRSGVGPTPIAGPGTAFTTGNARYLQAAEQQGMRPDIISTHAYDPTKTHELPSLAPLVAETTSAGRKPIFVTEYGIIPKAWFSQQEASELPAYAVLTVAEMLALYSTGANAAFYWQAQNAPSVKGGMALLSPQDRPRPAVGALRTVVQPLETGDQIAAPEPRKPPLPILLVARPSQLVLQLANPLGEAQDFDIQTRNCTAAPPAVTRSTTWPSDRSVTAHAAGPGGVQVRLPAETVVSLTMTR
jgi:hypothetical protein